MTASFFSTVTRYERTPNRNPGEDRLTQVLASICQFVPDFAGPMFSELILRSIGQDSLLEAQREFLHQLGGERCPKEVITQRNVQGVGRPDLLLCFAGGKLVIEVKGPTESDLTENQLRNYKDGLSGADILVLMAPSTYSIQDELRPKQFIHVTWQQSGEWIQAREQSTHGPVEGWLLGEYTTFLKEEQLMNDRIEVTDKGTEFDQLLNGLDKGRKLEDFLGAVGARVEGVLEEQGWRSLTTGARGSGVPAEKSWPARIRNWEQPEPSGEDADLLEWRIGGSDEDQHSWTHLAAGVVFRPKGKDVSPLSFMSGEELSSLQLEHGIQGDELKLITESFDTHQPWFIAIKPLSAMLEEAGKEGGGDFTTQVRFVADWILLRMWAAGRITGLISGGKDHSWTS